jgi:type II secretion system protein N
MGGLQLTEKQKRMLKWIGYPVLALVTFVFAVAHTFPYDRLKSKIEAAVGDRYHVDIESIRPKFFPGGVVVSGVSLRSIPQRPDEQVIAVFIDRVELDVGLLAAIGGRLDLDLLVEVGDGTLEGRVGLSKAALSAKVKTEQLPLASLPGLQEAVGLPMAGGLDARLEVELPQQQWSQASGSVSFACIGCTIGDGVSTLQMRPPEVPAGRRQPRMAFGGEGVTVPRLNLGNAMAEIEIQSGTGTIKHFAATSADGSLQIEGTINFRDPFRTSQFPGCMRFKLSDELKQRERDFGNIEYLLPPQSRQEDGTFAIPTKGTLSHLRWDVRRQCAGAQGPAGERDRPSISIRPEISDRGAVTRAGRDQEGEGEGEGAEPTETAESEADRLRRAAAEAPDGEPELDRPGASGPILSPTDIRGAGRPIDDVQPPDEALDPEIVPIELEEDDEEVGDESDLPIADDYD